MSAKECPGKYLVCMQDNKCVHVAVVAWATRVNTQTDRWADSFWENILRFACRITWQRYLTCTV